MLASLCWDIHDCTTSILFLLICRDEKWIGSKFIVCRENNNATYIYIYRWKGGFKNWCNSPQISVKPVAPILLIVFGTFHSQIFLSQYCTCTFVNLTYLTFKVEWGAICFFINPRHVWDLHLRIIAAAVFDKGSTVHVSLNKKLFV